MLKAPRLAGGFTLPLDRRLAYEVAKTPIQLPLPALMLLEGRKSQGAIGPWFLSWTTLSTWDRRLWTAGLKRSGDSGCRRQGFFRRPAFVERKAVRHSDEKYLDFEIDENGVPHAQPATEDEILGHERAALEVKFHQDEAKAAIFRNVYPQPFRRRLRFRRLRFTLFRHSSNV